MSLMRYLPIVVIAAFFALACNGTSKRTKSWQNQDNDSIIDSIPLKTITCPYDTFSYTGFNDIALFIAGIENNNEKNTLAGIARTREWQNYSVAFSSSWAAYDSTVIDVIQEWSATHLTVYDTVFYPFSGPDYNYINALFPNSNYYVLIGLEKTGNIPNINKMPADTVPVFLSHVKKSLYYNLQHSFFRTKSMEKELNTDMLDGTIPVLMLFLARHNQIILNMNPVHINSKGYIEISDTLTQYAHTIDKNFEQGVEIIFRNQADSSIKRLVYLSMDLSNKGIETNNSYTFINNYCYGNLVFLKAASYLCHIAAFSEIRNSILQHASYIVSDPSGIPYISFGDAFNVALYGEYKGPINLFKEYKQDKLKEDIDSLKPEKLPFKFGYHPNYWCMMVAVRK